MKNQSRRKLAQKRDRRPIKRILPRRKIRIVPFFQNPDQANRFFSLYDRIFRTEARND